MNTWPHEFDEVGEKLRKRHPKPIRTLGEARERLAEARKNQPRVTLAQAQAQARRFQKARAGANAKQRSAFSTGKKTDL